MQPARMVALCLSLFLAGCTVQTERESGEPVVAGGDFSRAVVAMACSRPPADGVPAGPYVSCFEPTVVVDEAGRTFVGDGAGGALARSLDDGRTFSPMDPPRLPPGAPRPSRPLDVTLDVDGQGRLYYSALLLQGDGGIRGFHLARSDDGGVSWPVNTYIPPPTLPESAEFVDRQWLAFGANDTVWLSYMQSTRGLWVAESPDGGASFRTFEQIAPSPEHAGRKAVGGRLVADGGRVAVAFFVKPEKGGEEAGELRVAIRAALGSWREATVATAPGDLPAGAFMPMVAVDGDHARVAWMGPGGSLFVTASRDVDGFAWGVPVAWQPNGTVVSASPWVLQGPDERTFVLAYTAPRFGEPTTLALYEGNPTGEGPAPNRTVVARDIPVLDPQRPANTDFAHFAFAPDGRVVVTWSDPSRGVLVAWRGN